MEIQESEEAFSIASVSGVGPKTGPGDAAVLRDLLDRKAVVVLRMTAPLEDDELQAVAGLFGPIKDPVAPTKDGGTLQYSAARQVIDSGFVMTDEVREKLKGMTFGGLDDQRPGLFETYHCDDTFTERPAGATVLHARALPPSGGGPTCFLDMRGAYDLLDAKTRDEIAGLQVHYAHNNEDAFPPRRAASGPADALVDVRHPLVRTHPRAGTRSLFLDLDRAVGIDGMSLEEGRALLQRLQDFAEAAAPRCEHDWHDHDVLLWDNGSVQHKAGGNFKVGEPRRFWRYMLEGDRPS